METLKAQIAFLLDVVEKRIASTNTRRKFYRDVAFYSFMSTSILAAVTMVLLGLDGGSGLQQTVKVIVLIISAVITVVNAFNAFYNHRELWVANNNVLNRFYKLRFDLLFYERSGVLEQKDVEMFKNTYQNILDELNKFWSKNRSDGQSK